MKTQLRLCLLIVMASCAQEPRHRLGDRTGVDGSRGLAKVYNLSVNDGSPSINTSLTELPLLLATDVSSAVTTSQYGLVCQEPGGQFLFFRNTLTAKYVVVPGKSYGTCAIIVLEFRYKGVTFSSPTLNGTASAVVVGIQPDQTQLAAAFAQYKAGNSAIYSSTNVNDPTITVKIIAQPTANLDAAAPAAAQLGAVYALDSTWVSSATGVNGSIQTGNKSITMTWLKNGLLSPLAFKNIAPIVIPILTSDGKSFQIGSLAVQATNSGTETIPENRYVMCLFAEISASTQTVKTFADISDKISTANANMICNKLPSAAAGASIVATFEVAPFLSTLAKASRSALQVIVPGAELPVRYETWIYRLKDAADSNPPVPSTNITDIDLTSDVALQSFLVQ